MDIFLTEAELQTLSAMRDQARNHEIGYWQIDQWLFQVLGGRGLATTNNQTMLWLAGATEANSNRGAMSMLIREFTATQYRLRYGKELAAGQLQAASDAVAEGMLADILGDSESIDGWPRGKVPDIARIAQADATAVGRVLFNVDDTDTAAELQSNSAWAGALLFTPLRSDQTGRLIRTGPSDRALDTLNDLRDVLYAAVSYAAALPAARSAFLAGSAEQKGRDLLTMGSTFLTDYLQGPATVQDLWTTVLAGASGGTVGAAIERIGRATPSVFLDMLMGAAQGEVLIGRTTDANFTARAHAFFSVLTPAQMQSMQVQMLPTAAAELAALAQTDVNVRAALAALSTVSVQVSPEVAQRLRLVDPATGQGEISTQWIERRAEMLHWMDERRRLGIGAEGGVITGQPVAANAAYTDAASGSTVLVGAVLPSQRAQVYFGDAAANTFSGFGRSDYLFGGAGDDNLSGQGGDDYLEGNAGTDTLEGGEGADTLLGGADEDRLDGGAGNDQLDGSAGADTYIVAARSGIDTLLTSDAADRLELDGRLLTGSGTLRSSTGNLTTWIDDSVATSPITYVYDSARGELSVSGSGSTVLVRDFASGDLGIAVPGEPAPRPLPATVQLIDFANTSGLRSRLSDWNRSGLPAATFINISAGWYRVEGGRNGDVLVGGSVLAPGEHTFGGIELVGRAGDDHLYAVAEQTEAQALAGTPALPPGPAAVEGPMLDGGQGDDFIVGSASDDLSFGGAGDDRIITGDGNDMVLSDGDLGPTFNAAAEFGQAPSVMTGGNSAGLDGGALNWRWLRGVSQKEYLLDVVAHPGYSLDGYSVNLGSHAIDPLDDVDLRVFASDTLVPFALPPGHALYAAFVEAHPEVEPGSFDLVLRGHSRAAGFNTFGFDPNDPDPQTRLLDSFSTARYAGADVISTGAGDDVVNAGGGNDVVDAGADQDVVAGYDGDDVVDGGSGDDLLFGDYLADPGGTGAGPTPLIDGLSGLVRGRRGLDPSRHGNDRMNGGEGRDHLIGGGGTDLLYGGEGNDELEGDEYGLAAQWSGNDRLDGGAGNDTLTGGGRDDDLLGGTGDDVLRGDAEIDHVAADAQGSDRLDGGEGNDRLYGGGRDDVLIGGSGDDQILGDDFEDKLPGELHGNDQLDGGEGNDSLLGGGGDDRILGGAGDDWLSGEDQEDTAAVSALQGDDLLDGGEGNDTLAGGNGRDLLIGGSGDDLLFGGDGDDVLDGGAGLDGMKGGAGDDRYVVRAGDVLPVQLADGVQLAESIDDREGRNVVVLVDGAAVTGLTSVGAGDLLLSLGTGRLLVRDALRGGLAAVESEAGTQSLSDLARLYLDSTLALRSSADGQVLLGGRRADQLTTWDAGTRLEGGQGDDIYWVDAERGGLVIALREGDGVDRLVGQAALGRASGRAENVLELGAGIARSSVHLRSTDNSQRLALVYGNAGDRAIFGISRSGDGELSASFDRVVLADGSSISLQELLQQGVQIAPAPFMQGTILNDRFSGDAGGNTYTGGLGDDTYVFGRGDGRDTVSATGRGETDRETVEFRDGVALADVLFVRVESDLLVRLRGRSDELALRDAFGTNPIDAFRFADGSLLRQADIVFAGMAEQATEGDDKIWGGPLPESVDAGAGQDYVDAGDGNDSVQGGAGRDSLNGGSGDDTLEGGSGDDILEGQDGSDRLAGGQDDDRLYGGTGNDTLIGGTGSDELYGDAGDDWLEDDGACSYETGRTALMVGGEGVDTYRLVRSRGLPTSDVVSVEGGADGGDRLILVGVDAANVAVRRRGSDLRLELTNARGEQQFVVTLVGQGRADTVAPVEEVRIEAEDGALAVWSATDLRRLAVQGTARNDRLIGFNGVDDAMRGGVGADSLWGAGGNDTLDGGSGNDLLSGEAGGDTYVFAPGGGRDRVVEVSVDLEDTPANVIQVAAGIAPADVRLVRTGQDGGGAMQVADSLVLLHPATGAQMWVDQYFLASGQGLATIQFADGTVWTVADVIARAGASVSGAADTQTGTAGDDSFVVDHVDDLIVEQPGDGTDSVRSSVSYALPTDVENLELSGVLGIDAIGNAGANLLRGNAGNNLLDGGGGADTMIGGAGDDVYRWVDPRRHDTLYADAFDLLTPAIIEAAGEGTDTIETNAFALALPDQVENLLVTALLSARGMNSWSGQTYRYRYVGNGLDNVIDLGAGSANWNWLSGPILGTVIDGGLGADTLRGTDIDDTYVVDNPGDVVVELEVYQNGYQRSTGDEVVSSVDYVLGANLEILTLQGSSAITGQGNVLGNVLNGAGNTAANVLAGLAGNDTYLIGQNDRVVEAAAAGFDTVKVEAAAGQAVVDLDVRDFAHIEVLKAGDSLGGVRLHGDAADNVLWGNRHSNVITGEDGNDTLYASAAPAPPVAGPTSDLLDGGNGDDVLVSRGGGDTLLGGAGDDTLEVSGDLTRWGSPVLDGGAGNDRVSVTSSHVTLVFGAGSDSDTVYTGEARTTQSWATSRQALSVIALTAKTDASQLRFSRVDNALKISLAGSADALTIRAFFEPGDGNAVRSGLDTLVLADRTILSRDAIVAGLERTSLQDAGNGGDLLVTSAGVRSLAGGGGDDQMFGQATADALDGGEGNDGLFSGDGADTLTGGAGADWLSGGRGADLYVFGAGWGTDVIDELQRAERMPSFAAQVLEDDGAIDAIAFQAGIGVMDIEGSKDGDDLILRRSGMGDAGDTIKLVGHFASGSAATGHVEEIRFADGTLWNEADILRLVSKVTGTADNDTLYALPSGGQLYGLAGDDWLEGGDGADSLFGGEGNDILRGNLGDDLLDGGAGGDSLVGGSGDDVYRVDSLLDSITEFQDSGIDSVESSVSWTLGAELENLVLTGSTAITGTGNALDNVLSGNEAANTLDGGAGSDTMSGGAGDDIYVVNLATDVVIEGVNEGIDLVRAGVSYTLSGHVENLTLTGTGGNTATGNDLGNVLTGNSGANTLNGGGGNDTLDGGSGTDTMRGGAGNDTYVVERTADVTIENDGEGTDTVLSSVTRTLGNFLENLTLTGSSAINAVGNDLGNVLVGNSGNNMLSGLAGNDTYDGGAGNDALTDTSTTSGEIYRFGIGYGTDTITDAGGTDRVELGTGIAQSQLVFKRNGNNLELTITGRTDKLIVANWYTAAANRIEQFRLADGSVVSPGLIPTAVPASAVATAADLVTQDQLEANAWEANAWFDRWQRGWLGGSMSHVLGGAPVFPETHGSQLSHDQQVHALVSAMASFEVPVGISGPLLSMAERPQVQWAVAAI